VLLKLLAEEESKPATEVKNRKCLEFTIVQVELGMWKWHFQIREAVGVLASIRRTVG
jgi:hypothetical protein